MLPNLSALTSNIEARLEGKKRSKVHVSDSAIDYMVKFASILRHHINDENSLIYDALLHPTTSTSIAPWYLKLHSNAMGEEIKLTDKENLQARYYYEQIIIADLNNDADTIYELVISINANILYENNDSQSYLINTKKWTEHRYRLVLLHRWLTFLRRNKFREIFTLDQITDPRSKTQYAEWLQDLGKNVETGLTEIDRMDDIKRGYSAFKICLLAELYNFDEAPKDELFRSQLFSNPDNPVHTGSDLDKVLSFLEMVFALLKSSEDDITKYSLTNVNFGTTSYLFKNAANIVKSKIDIGGNIVYRQNIFHILDAATPWVYLYNRWMITNDETIRNTLLNLIDPSLGTPPSSKASPSGTSS